MELIKSASFFFKFFYSNIFNTVSNWERLVKKLRRNHQIRHANLQHLNSGTVSKWSSYSIWTEANEICKDVSKREETHDDLSTAPKHVITRRPKVSQDAACAL